MDPSVNQSTVTFKVYFKSEIRKFSITSKDDSTFPSFHQFTNQLAKILGGDGYHKEMKYQYADESGDKITFTTNIEWNGAVDFFKTQNPVKITVLHKEAPATNFRNAPKPTPINFYQTGNPVQDIFKQLFTGSAENNSVTGRCQPGFPFGGPCLRNNKTTTSSSSKPVDLLSGGVPVPAPTPSPCNTKNVNVDINPETIEKLMEVLPQCLGRFFEDGKILPHHLPQWLNQVIDVKPVVENGVSTGDVDLDVNVTALVAKLNRKALISMGKSEYQEAERFLLDAIALDEDNSLALYNLSCVYSINYEVDRALTYIEKAVDAGYSRWQHMLRDNDLENIWQHERFQALVNRLQLADL